MEFCIISPIAGLERYATLSKTHLLLPQLDHISGYREFYQKCQKTGDFLILDNGAYEGCHDWYHLVKCIEIYKPNVVALPDYMLQDWDKTVAEATRFLDRYYDQFPWVKWMFIPQAKPNDIMGWVFGLEVMMRDERVSWVGLARVLTYAITSDPMMRVSCARTIQRMWPHIKLHALGMSKGSVEELNALRAMTHVKSIDSNAPVWRGWMGYKFNRNVQDWAEIPVDYNCPIPPNNDYILHNLEVVGVDVSCLRSGIEPQQQTVSGS